MKETIADTAAVAIMRMAYIQHTMVVREALSLLIVCLEGPNKKMQEKYFEHLIKNRDELFLSGSQRRLRDGANQLREVCVVCVHVHIVCVAPPRALSLTLSLSLNPPPSHSLSASCAAHAAGPDCRGQGRHAP